LLRLKFWQNGRMNKLTIRPALPGDAAAISALIVPLLPLLTLEPNGAGAEKFIETMHTPAIGRVLADDRYDYQLGYVDDELAGVAAVRDHAHLFHLFVATKWQGRGYGRLLWQAARRRALPSNSNGVFTVNSSPFALEMYRHLGFVATAPRAEHDGIAYIPMRLLITP
jgi:GNAT superfamily N-acetyltransferase